MAIRAVAAVRKLVIIEEGLLISMANSPVFLKEFPFLKAIQGVQAMPSGCGTCGANRARGSQRSATFLSAKQTLASMADDKRRTLKRLLNANQVRLTYKQGSRVVQHTF